MADPLSFLGTAVGVTSLIMQITDECIKGCYTSSFIKQALILAGFKLYSEAANMPETYRYLRVRMQIEQQRFLNFGLEAGILYADGMICTTLQINRSLLLAVLAEFKALLENYAAANAKYERLMPQMDTSWDVSEEPEMDLMDLLCPPPGHKRQGATEQSGKKKAHFKHARDFGNSIVQTGRNLRTIMREPKRLIWGTVDKESFECLISKLDDLNSVLIALLDSSQIRRLQDTMSTTYLEILQIRNDMESLAGLIKALAPIAKTQLYSGVGAIGSESNALFQTVAQETDAQKKQKEYLRQLVEIKIQYTKAGLLTDEPFIPSHFNDDLSTSLELDEFKLPEGDMDWGSTPQRTNTTYQGSSVWVEWKDIPSGSSLPLGSKQVEYRIRLLIDLLCHAKPDGFRAPHCVGYVKAVNSDDGARFGIVFKKPSDEVAKSKLVTLRELLGQGSQPSLSARMSLCAVLARCIHSFNSVNWLHKGLRSDNITFFASLSEQQDLSSPYVSGFELSRPSVIEKLTEKPNFKSLEDIYRHPNAQSSQTDGSYRKSYDIYSLGIIFVEIAFWKRIEDIVGSENLFRKPSTLLAMQSWLLGRPFGKGVALPSFPADKGSCVQQVAPKCGDAFRDIIECCLTADDVERPHCQGESEPSIALRLQKFMEDGIVKRLEHLSGALQGYT